MKKKLLFVIPSLEAGGGEKSLVTLLNTIDLQHYEVNLILLKNAGIFLKLLPKEVTIIPLEGNYKTFTQPISKAVFDFLKQGKISLAFSRLLFTFKTATIKNKGIAEQKSWKNIVKSIPKITKQYDAAIGFLEKSSIYFVVDCVEAKNKIGFIHNDYTKLDLDVDFDLPYFQKLNTIATVSEECKTVLQDVFPSQKEKVKVMYNIVSATLIQKMAEEDIAIHQSKPILLSIGRLHSQKGFDIAIKAAKILRQSNIDFIWYVIGEGAERSNLERLISENNLQNSFVLLGLKENPYPYIKAATIVVQSSRYEGKSIAIDEAKILQKPIIVTNFTTAKDQIEHLKNGIIAEMNPESLASGIESLIQNKNLQKELSLHLSQENFGTESEIATFYKIINNEF
jgi:glycosyltransferase involved in cell wall biosynthesis